MVISTVFQQVMFAAIILINGKSLSTLDFLSKLWKPLISMHYGTKLALKLQINRVMATITTLFEIKIEWTKPTEVLI